MAYPRPGEFHQPAHFSVLHPPCPVDYIGKNVYGIFESLTENHLLVPLYANTDLAWAVLGWVSIQKPDQNTFIDSVNRLWNFLIDGRANKDRDDPKHRRVRLQMLSALRVLGFRNALWNVDYMHIGPGDDDFGYRGDWDSVPDPPAVRHHEHIRDILAGPQSWADLANYWTQQADQYFQVPIHETTNKEPRSRFQFNQQQFTHYHRYNGFVSRPSLNGVAGPAVDLRAIPVPPGPDSIWQSIA